MSNPNYIITPNMNLNLPIPTVDPGPDWAATLNAALAFVDGHTHNIGSGVQITPSGLNINSNLPMNGNALIGTSFLNLGMSSTPATETSLYSPDGINIWFLDGNGNNFAITSGGGVNASVGTLTGGTAQAAFVSNVLVVNSVQSTGVPGNIQAQSVLFGNASAGTDFVTLSAPSSTTTYGLVLPVIPGSTQFMTLDASGNMGTASSISAAQIAAGSITGSQIATNVNLPGTSVTAGGQKVVVSNTNGTNQLAIIRGYFDGTHNPGSGTSYGEGWTATYGADITTITFTTPFSDAPVVTANCTGEQTISVTINSADAGSCTIYTGGFNEALHFIAIGQV